MSNKGEGRSVPHKITEAQCDQNYFNYESRIATEKIQRLRETVSSLKAEIKDVVTKIEQSIEMLKNKVTSKIILVLNLLSEKQSHIKTTLDNCYKIITSLIEVFLNIGYEFEKDINMICLKVNEFDEEIKHMINQNKVKNLDRGIPTLWFIDSEGRLTVRKNFVVSNVLPKFKCGDRKKRKKFIACMTEIFVSREVPAHLWVTLASNQLLGMALDWWNMHDSSMSWQEFRQHFIDWTFDDDNLSKKVAADQPSTGNRNLNNSNCKESENYTYIERSKSEDFRIQKGKASQHNVNDTNVNLIQRTENNFSIKFESLLNQDQIQEHDGDSSESGKESMVTENSSEHSSRINKSCTRKRKYPFTIVNEDTKHSKNKRNSKYHNNRTMPQSQYKLRTRKK